MAFYGKLRAVLAAGLSAIAITASIATAQAQPAGPGSDGAGSPTFVQPKVEDPMLAPPESAPAGGAFLGRSARDDASFAGFSDERGGGRTRVGPAQGRASGGVADADRAGGVRP